jgi:hypothetical protein
MKMEHCQELYLSLSKSLVKFKKGIDVVDEYHADLRKTAECDAYTDFSTIRREFLNH